MDRLGLFFFDTDLRLHDHAPLAALACRVDKLICLTCNDPALTQTTPGQKGDGPISSHRQRFLQESQQVLARQLAKLGQNLLVMHCSPREALNTLLQQFPVTEVCRSRHPGTFETRTWQDLQQRFPQISFRELDSRTLFSLDTLPFPLQALPPTFTDFRKQVENLTIPAPLPAPNTLPPPPQGLQGRIAAATDGINLPACGSDKDTGFAGGETAALNHVRSYFSSSWPRAYKDVRNSLDDWYHSTKFSPWLALGCVSPRRLLAELRNYERQHGANESTYWIFFELLWREYFQWYALRHGARLFHFRGIKHRHPLTSFYPERFAAWKDGRTPWPIVNACMHQLRETGYISNRGRQLVASCFVHELQLDWRYGAAYFEQQLIDYDMASNWGNWQYLAGVGADPRGHRHFDLDKQTRQHDPEGRFIQRWSGHETLAPLDCRDMVDWPNQPDA